MNTDTTTKIGNRIKKLRREKDMTQEDLAQKIGVTKATINKYEAGQVNFPRDRIEKLSEVLGVAPSYLLGWSTIQTPIASASAVDLFTFSEMQIEENQRHLLKQQISADTPAIQGTLTATENELLRVFRALNIRKQTELLMNAYKLEDSEEDM